MRPDVVFPQRRLLAGRVDRPLYVGQVERIERALPRLQVEVPKPAERPAELQAVIGIARVRDPLEDLYPPGVERIGPARCRAYRPAGQKVIGPAIGQLRRREHPPVGLRRIGREHVPPLVERGEREDSRELTLWTIG